MDNVDEIVADRSGKIKLSSRNLPVRGTKQSKNIASSSMMGSKKKTIGNNIRTESSDNSEFEFQHSSSNSFKNNIRLKIKR